MTNGNLNEVKKSNSLSEIVPSRGSDDSRMMRTVRAKRQLSTSAEPIRVVSASAFSSSTIYSNLGLGHSFNKSDFSLYNFKNGHPGSEPSHATTKANAHHLSRSFSLDDNENLLDRSLHLPHNEALYGNHRRPGIPRSPMTSDLIDKMGKLDVGKKTRTVKKKPKSPQPSVATKKNVKVTRDKQAPSSNNRIELNKRILTKGRSLDQSNVRRISAAHGRHSVKPISTLKPVERQPKLTDKYTSAEYEAMAAKTVSVIPFVKLAYPDVQAAFPNLPLQPLKFYPEALK